ncbi:MAG: DHHA1 domain-containing protein [Bacillota bacterium]|nr:DHHA1 domain-containing protein [Bacillota bacterium]
MTENLFISNSYIAEFTADIVNIIEKNSMFMIELDKTCFYPEGGGQPSDIGFIGNCSIFDVQYENDKIYHYSKDKPANNLDVKCRIDWNSRFDLMQQHSGQHILSSTFEKLFDANTVGFHLSNDTVTIDLDKKLGALELEKAENMSNEIVFKNLPIIIHYPDKATLNQMPLRKPPKVLKNIRIIEVENFDFSPCGGTHVNNTGEIGLVKIKKFENHKNGIRLEFVCGNRALKDYRLKNDLINKLAADMSVSPDEIENSYEKSKDDTNLLITEIKDLKQQLIGYKINDLNEHAEVYDDIKLIKYEFRDIDMKSVKTISSKIVNEPGYITLFSLVNDDVKLLFARSKNVDVNMKDIIKEPLELINGRGGGSPFAAQGGGNIIDNANLAIETAYMHVKSLL